MYGKNTKRKLLIDSNTYIIKRMDSKYLDKVIDRIVDETTKIDKEFLDTPFYDRLSPVVFTLSYNALSYSPYYSFFEDHCRDVYGLNDDEAYYVWKKYAKILSRSNYFWFW